VARVARVILAHSRGGTVAGMDTAAFDRLTHDFAHENEATAFLVSRMARHTLRGAVHEPSLLHDYLTSRTWIPKSLYPLVTKAAVLPMDLSSGLGTAMPEARAFLAQVDRVSPLAQIDGILVDGNVVGTIQTGNATASWAGDKRASR
jgi:hypothetical protein